MLVGSNAQSPWTYICSEGLCVKTEASEQNSAPSSLSVCLLTCSPDTLLWPLPRIYNIGDQIIGLNPDKIFVESKHLKEKFQDVVDWQV